MNACLAFLTIWTIGSGAPTRTICPAGDNPHGPWQELDHRFS